MDEEFRMEKSRLKKLLSEIKGEGTAQTFTWMQSENVLRRIFNHFDQHEPAVADAIRYGLKDEDTIASWTAGMESVINESDYHDQSSLYTINYPEGHNA